MPLWASFLTGVAPGPELRLRLELVGHDGLGRFHEWWHGERAVAFEPWLSRALEPVAVPMPATRAVAVLRATLEDAAGRVLHRNFTSFAVGRGRLAARRDARRGRPQAAAAARGPRPRERGALVSLRHWTAIDGRKQNGAGAGYFEYRLRVAEGAAQPRTSRARASSPSSGPSSSSARTAPTRAACEGDFMLGGGHARPGPQPERLPHDRRRDLPERGADRRERDRRSGRFDLPDDPADHRGLLSWHAQKRDGHLDEAGSYGTLVSASVPAAALAEAARSGELRVRLEVDEALPGGLAVYGEASGRYPLDPTLVLTLAR